MYGATPTGTTCSAGPFANGISSTLLPRVAGHPQMLVVLPCEAGGVSVALLRLAQFEAVDPLVLAVVLPLGDAHVHLGIAGVDALAVDEQADDAEAGSSCRPSPRTAGSVCLIFASLHVEENEVFHVLDDHRLAVVGEGEIDGPAGKGDLFAGGLEDLIGRHDDAAIGLDADFQLVVIIAGGQRHQRDGGEEEENGEETHHWGDSFWWRQCRMWLYHRDVWIASK